MQKIIILLHLINCAHYNTAEGIQIFITVLFYFYLPHYLVQIIHHS